MTLPTPQKGPEIQKLLEDAPRWNSDTVPNLSHEEAYDFVKYDLPKILRYIRQLEKEHREMRETFERIKTHARGCHDCDSSSMADGCLGDLILNP